MTAELVRSRRRVALLAVPAFVVVVGLVQLLAGRPPSGAAPVGAALPVIDGARGFDWVRQPNAGLGPESELRDVIAFGDGLVAIGDTDAPGWAETVVASTDGVRWTGAAGGVPVGALPVGLQLAGDRLVLNIERQDAAGNPVGELLRSDDGIDWTSWLSERPGEPLPVSVARARDGWIGASEAGVMSSADGLAWTVDQPLPVDASIGPIAGDLRGGVAVINRYEGARWRPLVLVADGPGRWHAAAFEPAGDALVDTLVAGPWRYVATGMATEQGPAPDPREWAHEDLDPIARRTIWWSPDGRSWQRSISPRIDSDEIRVVPCGRGFLALLPEQRGAWWSPDGERWTPLPQAPDTSWITGAVVTGDRVVVFGVDDDGHPAAWLGTPR